MSYQHTACWGTFCAVLKSPTAIVYLERRIIAATDFVNLRIMAGDLTSLKANSTELSHENAMFKFVVRIAPAAGLAPLDDGTFAGRTQWWLNRGAYINRTGFWRLPRHKRPTYRRQLDIGHTVWRFRHASRHVRDARAVMHAEIVN